MVVVALLASLLRHLLVACCVAASFARAAWAGGETDELERLLDQPVYAGARHVQQAAAAPASVTILTAGDIRAFGWRTLGEVLNAVRGVHLRDDRGYTYLGVRGFGRPGDYTAKVQITIDGMRIGDNIYEQSPVGHELPLDVELIERVEFIAGPGAVLYGGNAVMGVVNIVTKSASALGGTEWSAHAGSAGARGTSLRHGRSWTDGSLVLGLQLGRLRGDDLYFPAFDAPPVSDGIQRGADGERWHKAFARFNLGDWSLTALQSERRKNQAGAPWGSDFSAPYPLRDRYRFVDAHWHRDAGALAWYARATAGGYDYDEVSYYDGSPYDFRQSGRWIAGELRAVWQAAPAHRVLMGVEGQRNLRQYQHATFGGDTLTDVDTHGHRVGVIAHDDWTLHHDLRLVLGARWDRLQSGAQLGTPRLAALWRAAEGVHVKALLGRAFREPNAWETANDDGGVTMRANPELRPERVRAGEIAVEVQRGDAWRWGTSWYRNQVLDQIEHVEIEPGVTQPQNKGRASGEGIELEAEWMAPSGWRWRGSWSRADATDHTTGLRLSNAPRSLTKLHAVAPLPWPGLRLGLQWVRLGQRLSSDGTAIGSSHTLNATVRWAPVGSRWSGALSAYNLLDRANVDPGAPEFVSAVIPQPGRRWLLSATCLY